MTASETAQEEAVTLVLTTDRRAPKSSIPPISPSRGTRPGSYWPWLRRVCLSRAEQPFVARPRVEEGGLRRTKVSLLYKKTGNLRACQLLLGTGS